MIVSNKQWIYTQRPSGQVNEEHYTLHIEKIDASLLQKEDVLVKAKYISVDPYMRIQQSALNTWEEPHPIGVVQGSGMTGEVIGSNSDILKVGDWVNCYTGWQQYAIVNEKEVRLLDPEMAPVSTSLGILGMPARVAYFGLKDAGKLKAGETVVVSGAAGAVGSVVVQIAKLKGCRVVGIAGTQEKMDFLKNTLGVDATINYKENRTQTLMTQALQNACPDGIDVYYDNVGGIITDAVFDVVNVGARVLICGQISQYNHGLDTPDMGPRFLHKVLYKRITIQGILSRDYNDRMLEMIEEMGPWVRDDKLIYKETIIEGFENLPKALSGLFEGKNIGKMIVKV